MGWNGTNTYGVRVDVARYAESAGSAPGDNLGNHTATTTLNMNSNTISNVGDILATNNYGTGLVGVYDSYRYQNVFAMGTSYRLAANGTNPGNLYGLAWTHTNVGGQSKSPLSHQLLVMENGVTKVALGTGIWMQGDLTFNSANPYINASSYFISPGGAYFNSGTVYFEAATQHRAGISNDGSYAGGDVQVNENLRISGVVPCIQGNCPSNNAIRLTPNLHLNSNAGNAVILNWDNGTTGATQTLRVGNGAGSDVFYVYADGQTFTTNWFRPLGQSGLYFQDYGGGFHMTDGTWIRAYNSKPVLGTGGFAGYGNAIGSVHGIAANMYANYNNAGGAGIVVSDDGGIGDYNDAWLQWRASSGIHINSNNSTNLAYFNMVSISGGLYDKYVIPSHGNYGYLGTSGNYWYYMYANNIIDPSRRDLKRDITPLKESLYEQVMADIDKLQPSFYKYKHEKDELDGEYDPKYRPNMHLGVILDEAPDYIQDNAFSGVDIYALSTLSLAGVKYNREEIKEIKETLGMNTNSKSINDFGSYELTGNEVWVNFNEDFSMQLNAVIPVVTVTPNKEGIILSVVEKNSKGFRVNAQGNISSASFDYVAMAKVQLKAKAVEENQSNEALINSLSVDQAIKDKVTKWWSEAPARLKATEDKAREDAKLITEQRSKELALPSDFERPENSGKHDPKANDANALIEKSNKELKSEEPAKDAPTKEMWQDEKYKYQASEKDILQVNPGSNDKSNAPK